MPHLRAIRQQIIESEISLRKLLDVLGNPDNVSVAPPSLCLDLEQTKSDPHGYIAILSLFVVPTRTVYLVDVFQLGRVAFDAANEHGLTLRNVLESNTACKLAFDVRKSASALCHQYGVLLRGVQEIQLLELASRSGSRLCVDSLAECIEASRHIDPDMKAAWLRSKDLGLRQFHYAEVQNPYEALADRPVPSNVVLYCTHSVILLPELYEKYDRRLHRLGERESCFWRRRIYDATQQRIFESQSPYYNSRAPISIYGPWAPDNLEEAWSRWEDENWFREQNQRAMQRCICECHDDAHTDHAE